MELEQANAQYKFWKRNECKQQNQIAEILKLSSLNKEKPFDTKIAKTWF